MVGLRWLAMACDGLFMACDRQAILTLVAGWLAGRAGFGCVRTRIATFPLACILIAINFGYTFSQLASATHP